MPDRNQEVILPNKNTIEEFKGVKLSSKYDFHPDKLKYAEEPPKAGANKKDNADNQKAADKTAAQAKATVNDGEDDVVESEDDEELDLDDIKRKHLKVGPTQ